MSHCGGGGCSGEGGAVCMCSWFCGGVGESRVISQESRYLGIGGEEGYSVSIWSSWSIMMTSLPCSMVVLGGVGGLV
jgi:hypothetical protein